MFNAVKFFKDHGISYSIDGKNVHKGWVGVRCPFCHDHSDHLGFNLNLGYFRCWICGYHTIPEVIQWYITGDWKTTYEIWKQYTDDSPTIFKTKDKIRSKSIEIPKDTLTKYEKIYLEDRGYDWKFLVEKYDLRGGGISGRWKFRIIIPVYQGPNIVTFTARAIADSMSPRYLSLKPEESIVAIKETLFNINNCKNERIIVVEGPFDAMRLGDNCCAAYNADLTPQQVSILLQYKKIDFLFDNEKPAQKKAQKYAEILAAFGKDTEIFCLDTVKDVGELSNKGAEKLKKELKI